MYEPLIYTQFSFIGFFACNHHRAPLYFAESITSEKGFWGWPCSNFFMYLIGLCPPTEPQILAGDKVSRDARGFHLIITSSVAPFAVGKFTKPLIEILRTKMDQERNRYRSEIEHNNQLRRYISEIIDIDNDFVEDLNEINRVVPDFLPSRFRT